MRYKRYAAEPEESEYTAMEQQRAKICRANRLKDVSTLHFLSILATTLGSWPSMLSETSRLACFAWPMLSFANVLSPTRSLMKPFGQLKGRVTSNPETLLVLEHV